MTLILKENHLMKFNPDTLIEVRKEYGLDELGMKQSVDILQGWVEKQEHFTKKDFSREHLERVIISTKGSVERAKTIIDKMCTMRTMVPEMFDKCHAKNDFPNLAQFYINLQMPQMTEDNYRIFITQVKSSITSSILMEAYKYSVIMCEYLKLKDYAPGSRVIVDVRNVNIMDLVVNMNVIDLRNIMTLYTEGFGFRIKGIYILSSSKMIDTLVGLLKKVVSSKIGERIQVFKEVESLYEYIPKQLLPEDYGGDEKSISALYDEWTEELSSEEHVKYVEEMRWTWTNEDLRRSSKYNEEYLGMPGSFKLLTVD